MMNNGPLALIPQKMLTTNSDANELYPKYAESCHYRFFTGYTNCVS